MTGDWMLLMVAIKPGTSLTLSVQGTVISGEVIAIDDYRTRVMAAINADAGERAPVTDDILGHVQRRLLEETTEEDRQERNFVHLQNARKVSGGKVVKLGSGLWRGRLASVDGWLPGLALESEGGHENEID